MMTPLNDKLSVKIPTAIGKPDYRAGVQELIAALQDLLHYAIEEFPEPSEQLHDALESGKRTLQIWNRVLERGAQ